MCAQGEVRERVREAKYQSINKLSRARDHHCRSSGLRSLSLGIARGPEFSIHIIYWLYACFLHVATVHLI